MTCRYWSSFAGAAAVAALSMLQTAQAAELPPVKVTKSNAVAECATPGRLMAYLRNNNPALNPKFNSVAAEYMRHGEALGLRWDYAFFQMLLETGYLKFTGDVKADQNNFAGLGATGKGARGESFKDVSTGVRAHIEHLLMYSGTRVENPVAERTRNVQDWGVLVPWQKSIGQPITFAQLAKQWAPTSRKYAIDIQSIADRFFAGPCLGADPEPQLVADVRGDAPATAKPKDKPKTAAVKSKSDETAASEPKGKAKEVADKAIDEQRKDAAAKKSALGANEAGAQAEKTAAPVTEAPAEETRTASDFAPQKAQPPVKIINAAEEAEAGVPAASADTKVAAVAEPQKDKPAKAQDKKAVTAEVKSTDTKAPEGKAQTADLKTQGSDAKTPKAEKADAKAGDDKATKVAALTTPGAGAATAKSEKKAAAAPPAASGKCRVWTASYGGSKAIIIKAVVDKTTNYTVLDVNEGSERREADAYIDAYAKGGEKLGEFSSQPQALEKAFELCPEG